MRLETGMSLYHGSYAEIIKIDLGKCASGKDFGKGFYLTSDQSQARHFVSSSLRKAQSKGEASGSQAHGFVTEFKVLDDASSLLSLRIRRSKRELALVRFAQQESPAFKSVGPSDELYRL